MMRRRFRRRKASWTYADSGTLVLSDLSQIVAAQPISFAWIMPPARAQFIMDTKQRNSITFAGAHLWLDFYWRSAAAGISLQDIDFTVFKTTISADSANFPDVGLAIGQWDQPATPAALTSWDEDDDDGTESFLWQHHIKGFSPPNASVLTHTTGDDSRGNQYTFGVGTSDDPAYVCRKFHVTQEWQPDVVVRSKRRLQKGEGIILVMTANAAIAANLTVFCDYHLRTLTK